MGPVHQVCKKCRYRFACPLKLHLTEFQLEHLEETIMQVRADGGPKSPKLGDMVCVDRRFKLKTIIGEKKSGTITPRAQFRLKRRFAILYRKIRMGK